jgi:hypothetical protein
MIRCLLAFVVCCAIGCAGLRSWRPLSADCRAQVDRCLADCPTGAPRPSEALGDSRTACESRCGDVCMR